jgi:hypothetical protein
MTLKILSLCPFPLGLVRWESSGVPMTTLVVKATFHLDGDGQARIATTQRELSDDRPLREGEPGELAYASDFVPVKSRPEFLVMGHAQSSLACQSLDVVVAIGSRRRAVVASSAVACKRIPLSQRTVRSLEGRPTTLGPRVGYSTPARVPRGDAAMLADVFDAASDEQAIDADPERSVLKVWGLLRDGAVREVQLPGLRPVVCLGASKGHAPRNLALQCDTLIVDGTDATCSLLWRVSLPTEELDDSTLLVAISLGDAVPGWADLEWQIGHATQVTPVERTIGVEEERAVSSSTPPSTSDAPLLPAMPTFSPTFAPTSSSHSTLSASMASPLRVSTQLAPTPAAPAALASTPTTNPEFDNTATLDRPLVSSRPATPFESPRMGGALARLALPTAETLPRGFGASLLVSQDTLEMPAATANAPLPFRETSSSAPPPRSSAMDLRDLLALLRVLERASDPHTVLQAAGVTFADWCRAQREWLRRASADPATARDVLSALDREEGGSTLS